MKFQSPHTRRSYFNDIKSFFYFLQEKKITIEHIHDISLDHAILWRDSLNGLTPSSLRRKLYALSSLFEFAIKRKLVNENPFDFIQKPKAQFTSKTNAFTLDEVQKILSFLKENLQKYEAMPTQDVSYQKAFRDYALIACLFSIGLRVSELCSLRIEDLENAGGIAKIHIRNAKGKKEHSPIIHPSTCALLEHYIHCVHAGKNRSWFLFQSSIQKSKDQSIHPRSVYNLIQAVSKSVGITKKVSPHSCRATLATLLHNRGVPISQIQQLLNHKSILTTSVYIKKATEIEDAAATKIKI